MSTRSRIGILHADGTTETIYCHSDGYPDQQMPILTGHYENAEKVKALLALGDISYLAERIAPDAEEPHSFENPADGVTVAYHRDRNEPPQPAQRHSSIDALKADNWDISFFYLFDAENGAWLTPIKG